MDCQLAHSMLKPILQQSNSMRYEDMRSYLFKCQLWVMDIQQVLMSSSSGKPRWVLPCQSVHRLQQQTDMLVSIQQMSFEQWNVLRPLEEHNEVCVMTIPILVQDGTAQLQVHC